MAEQLGEWDKQVGELEVQLSRLKEDAPPLLAKGRPVQEFFFKERFLEEEKLRYLTYGNLLRARLEERGPDGAVTAPSLTMAGTPNGAVCSSTISEVSEGNSALMMEQTSAEGQSGQSDRLSYRAAISSWAANDGSLEETVC